MSMSHERYLGILRCSRGDTVAHAVDGTETVVY